MKNERAAGKEGGASVFASKVLTIAIVLSVGLIVGDLLSATSMIPQERRPTPFDRFPPRFPSDPLLQYHVVLTTVEVALLVALVVIYLRMYVATRANFAAGLVVMLGAFLLEAVLSYPLLVGLLAPVNLGPGFITPSADVIAICAYTVFLYLSLE